MRRNSIDVISTEDEPTGWTSRNIEYLKDLLNDVEESIEMYSIRQRRLSILSKVLSSINIITTALSAAISFYNQDESVDGLDITLSVTTTTALLCQTSLKVFDIDKMRHRSSIAKIKLNKLTSMIEMQLHNIPEVRMDMNQLLQYIASERDVVNLTITSRA